MLSRVRKEVTRTSSFHDFSFEGATDAPAEDMREHDTAGQPAEARPGDRGGPDLPAAISAAGLAAWRWVIGAPTVEWSAGAADVLGVPDVVLRSPQLLLAAVHPSDRPLLRESVVGLVTAGSLAARGRIVIGSEIRWYELSGRLVIEDDHPPVVTGIAEKVTERQEADDAVVGALRDYESLMDLAQVTLTEWRPGADVVRVLNSPAGVQLFRQTPGEVSLGDALERVDPVDRPRIRDGLTAARAGQEGLRLVVQVRDEDGADRQVLLAGGRVRGSCGRLTIAAVPLD